MTRILTHQKHKKQYPISSIKEIDIARTIYEKYETGSYTFASLGRIYKMPAWKVSKTYWTEKARREEEGDIINPKRNQRVYELRSQGFSSHEVSVIIHTETGETISPKRVNKIARDYKRHLQKKEEAQK